MCSPIEHNHNSWDVLKAHPAACSKDKNYPWPKQITHSSPYWDCECGYYSFKTLELAMENSLLHTIGNVLGEAVLWGKIIECEDGYRSEFAYPTIFYYLKESQLDQLTTTNTYAAEDLVRKFANIYHVEVKSLPDEIFQYYLICRDRFKKKKVNGNNS